MPCYITHVASFLPGPAVQNEDIQRHIGVLDGESEIQDKVLSMNGIVQRHYAQDDCQQQTHDVYQLAALAAKSCLDAADDVGPITYLAAGTTYAPLAAPGFASLLHHRLRDCRQLNHPVEVSSHAGICSSAIGAMIAGIRAVSLGDHQSALCIGAEHSTAILKADVIRPIDDRAQHTELRHSQWFMSVFLRFMLSDGAGTFLLQDRPNPNKISLRVNWSHSMSFANETSLCMQLDARTALLRQDVSVLSRHLVPCSNKLLAGASSTHNDTLDAHTIILPHMSSFFFRRKMERVISAHSNDPQNPTPYWTNLATAGNTGAASIYVMLDQYLKSHNVQDGDRILLFVPESGQFNFVLVSLTAVVP